MQILSNLIPKVSLLLFTEYSRHPVVVNVALNNPSVSLDRANLKQAQRIQHRKLLKTLHEREQNNEPTGTRIWSRILSHFLSNARSTGEENTCFCAFLLVSN